MIFTLFYPLIIVAMTYWSFGIDNSPGNIFLFLLMALEINLLAGTIGFLIGVSTDDHFTGRVIANQIQFFCMLTSGGLANADTFPLLVKKIQFMSPNRYGTEAFFRIISYHETD